MKRARSTQPPSPFSLPDLSTEMEQVHHARTPSMFVTSKTVSAITVSNAPYTLPTGTVQMCSFSDSAMCLAGGLYPSSTLLICSVDKIMTKPVNLLPRTLHATCRFEEYLIIHGGTQSPISEYYTNMISGNYLFLIDVKTMTAKKCELSGDAVISKRVGHRVIQLDSHRILLCGGISENEVLLSDAYTIDMDSFVVTQRRDLPMPLANFALEKIQSKIFLCAGLSNNGCTNHLYTYDDDLDSWFHLPVPPFEPRKSIGSCAYKDFLIIAMGWNGMKILYDDIWTYNVVSHEWRMLGMRGQLPTKRFGPLLAIIGHKMIIGGGMSGKNMLARDDCYIAEMLPLLERSCLTEFSEYIV